MSIKNISNPYPVAMIKKREARGNF